MAALALFCSILWGSAFACVKIGYGLFSISVSDSGSQLLFAGVRFFIAGIMTLLFGSVSQKRLLLPTKAALPKIAVISLFQTVLQYFFYYIGLARTTGVKTAIIVGANVFIAILVSSLLYRLEKLTAAKVAGCALGVGGIVLINLSGLEGLKLDLFGDGFIFLSTCAYAFSSVYMKKYSADENPVMLSGWQFAVGGAVLTAAGLLMGGKLDGGGAAGWGMLMYLSFVSAAAYSVWAALLKYNPVSKVTVFGFMNPVCGVIISTLLLNEKGIFGIRGAVSLALICAGIYIVNRSGKRS